LHSALTDSYLIRPTTTTAANLEITQTVETPPFTAPYSQGRLIKASTAMRAKPMPPVVSEPLPQITSKAFERGRMLHQELMKIVPAPRLARQLFTSNPARP